MRSMPAFACFCTTSATADRTRAASAGGSTGIPSSFAYMILMRSSGRGRLPVCVVRNRSVLWTMRLPCSLGRIVQALAAGGLGAAHLQRADLRARLAHLVGEPAMQQADLAEPGPLARIAEIVAGI